MSGEAAPLIQVLTVPVAAAAQAAEASGLTEAPFDGTFSAASMVPVSAITGANTDSRTIQVINRGQAGAGGVVMATKAFTSGVNAPAEQELPLTLSATASDLVIASGDVLEVKSLHVGAGLAAPQLIARLGFSRIGGS